MDNMRHDATSILPHEPSFALLTETAHRSPMSLSLHWLGTSPHGGLELEHRTLHRTSTSWNGTCAPTTIAFMAPSRPLKKKRPRRAVICQHDAWPEPKRPRPIHTIRSACICLPASTLPPAQRIDNGGTANQSCLEQVTGRITMIGRC